MKHGQKILLLLGGESGEREVSCATGEACAEALRDLGYAVRMADPLDPAGAREPGGPPFGEGIRDEEPGLRAFTAGHMAGLLNLLREEDPELVFNCLHGGFGEDGRLAALLEMLDLPQTGSPSLASALAMDKARSKQLMLMLGIPTADWLLLPALEGSAVPDNLPCWPVRPGALSCDAAAEADPERLVERFGLPLVIKPNRMGSSVGVEVVEDAPGVAGAIEAVRKLGEEVLIETFLPGKEITVAWLAGRSLPVVEIRPREGWYDYSHKYSGGTDYVCPAALPAEQADRLLRQAGDFNRWLGCSGVTRCDFRLDDQGLAWCLELNTTPGMTSTSLVPKAAAAAGMDFPAMLELLVEQAMT